MQLSYNSDSIHLIFDKMVTPLINDLEHKSRNSIDDEEHIITGLKQKRPKNWLNAPCNSLCKTTLVAFLIRY